MKQRIPGRGGSLRRQLRWLALLAVAALAFVAFLRLYRAEDERSVQVFAQEGKTAFSLEATGLRSSEVESCVWYVGEEEVLREDSLCSYSPAEEDIESFIRVEVTLTDGTVLTDEFYYSVLPVLYLESDTPYDWVEREYVDVSMRLTDDAYTSAQLYEGEAEIHLRGNSTSELPKHPFKLRLAEKADLLGMGESKHWVLLANAIDSTLMRNQLAAQLAEGTGTILSMDSRQVSLIYNGKYRGVYELCEQVRIDEERVDIYEWEESADTFAEQITATLLEDLPEGSEEALLVSVILQEQVEEELEEDLSWLEGETFVSEAIAEWNASRGTAYPLRFEASDYLDLEALPAATGGVILEIDNHRGEDDLTTAYCQPVSFAEPEAGETWEPLFTYIQTSVQSLEYALHDTDFTYHSDSPHYQVTGEATVDEEAGFVWEGAEFEETDYQETEYDGWHYSEFLDLDSFADNFILGEVTGNWDAMKKSVYFYKDIDGVWEVGPAWDYDWAFGNSMGGVDAWLPQEWLTTSAYVAQDSFYQTTQWNRYLIRDPYFLARVYERYQEVWEPMLEVLEEGDVLDEAAAALAPAAEANDQRWGGSMGIFEGQTFAEGIEQLKDYLEERCAWLEEQFESVETLRTSLGYYVTSEAVQVEEAETARIGKTAIRVTASFEGCTAVSLQVNGLYFYEAALEEDGTALFWVDNDVLRDGGNVAQARLLDAEGAYLVNPEGTTEGDYTNAVSGYLYFEK